jgi:hypothetical protein
VSRLDRLGQTAGRFLGAMAVGFKSSLGPAAAPPPQSKAVPAELRAYRVSILPLDAEALDAADREPLQVVASSPENAAEKRCGQLADKLHAAGKHRNRSFRAHVEWPEGAPGQAQEREVRVAVALLIKCEAIDEKGGPTWGA